MVIGSLGFQIRFMIIIETMVDVVVVGRRAALVETFLVLELGVVCGT